MARTVNSKRKTLVIVSAMVVVALIAALGAYFTSTDSATNTFVVGEVDIYVDEPSWEEPTNITPNQEILKDPQIVNQGVNDAFVFMKVTVPKADVITAAMDGTKAASAVTQLFQLNATADSAAARAWSGTDSINTDDWVLVSADTTAADVNVYIYAYAKNGACTVLAPAARTSALFNSVTFCNAIEGEGLEKASFDIGIDVYGIQTNNLGADDVTAPADVWAILVTQSGGGAQSPYNDGMR